MGLLLKLIPASVIRYAGKLQFRYPALQPAINKIAQRVAGSGTIQRGAGKGLKFDARGCNPGYLAGTSQPLEQELLAKYSPPGGTVYDLGANAGFYAIIAAKTVGPAGQIYAFEPSPELSRRIRTNAAANGFTNVEVIESAVFNTDGQIDFGLVGDLSVSNSINASGAAQKIAVPCTRIDTFAANHRPPDLILIDVEGAEAEALQGAMQSIREHQPVIMVEVHWLGEKFTTFVEQNLKPLGYAATTYDGQPLPPGAVRYHALLLPRTRSSPQKTSTS